MGGNKTIKLKLKQIPPAPLPLEKMETNPWEMKIASWHTTRRGGCASEGKLRRYRRPQNIKIESYDTKMNLWLSDKINPQGLQAFCAIITLY